MKVVFVTDPHGSDAVFFKALDEAKARSADVLVIGGDLQGKFLTPIVLNDQGVQWEEPISGSTVVAPAHEISSILERIAVVGGYGRVWDEAQLAALDDASLARALGQEAEARLRCWVNAAAEFSRKSGIAVFINPGNDDPYDLDSILEHADGVVHCEHRVVEICGYSFFGIAEVPTTPWGTPRERDEAGLSLILESARASLLSDGPPLILCSHSPPFGCGLDSAPALGTGLRLRFLGGMAETRSAGSKAVRSFLDSSVRVPLALHGHFHEAGGFARVGRCLCLNPGSEYGRGILCGYSVELIGDEVVRFERFLR